MRQKNKSSSFYGEEYYQNARIKASTKKQIYRERYKQFYDQQPELQILRYYKNLEERCQMRYFFETMKTVYMEFEHKVFVKTNEQYNTAVEEFLRKMKLEIDLFHQKQLCNEYITRQEYTNLKLRSAEDCKRFWQEQDNIKWENDESDRERRLLTCNLCPIFMEQFEFNLNRIEKIITNSHHYWQRLNGSQKMKKFKNHFKRTLKVLFHELIQKCEYANLLKNAHKMTKIKKKE